MTDLATASAVTLATLVRERKASPVEVVDAVLARVDAVEPRLNAFVVLDAERARSSAVAAEAAVMSGAPLGPLHGVPVTIKDIQAIEGLPTRRGSKLSPQTIATTDAPLVARLKAAGAIILGKTAMTEQGWTAVSHNPLTGATHNPWKHGFTAGGSSSGAATLAAAGCGPLHLGTDGAGSIRLPAHFCGLVGLKPTFGTVPYAPTPNNAQLSHAGPIARSVADAELMLEAMAGPHPLDATSHPAGYRRDRGGGVAGLRIGYSADLGHARVDPEVASVVSEAVRAFEALGAHVEAVTPSWGPLGPEIIRAMWGAALLPYAPRSDDERAAMDPDFVACIDASEGVSWREVNAALARRVAYAVAVSAWFAEGFDLLVTPAASVTAFPVGRQRPPHWPEHAWDWLAWAEFSYPFNLSHAPAVSVPCGLSRDGLPIGLQIAGPRFSDGLVMRAATAFLEARPFAHRMAAD